MQETIWFKTFSISDSFQHIVHFRQPRHKLLILRVLFVLVIPAGLNQFVQILIRYINFHTPYRRILLTAQIYIKFHNLGIFVSFFISLRTNLTKHETEKAKNHLGRLHPCEPQGCKDGGDSETWTAGSVEKNGS